MSDKIQALRNITLFHLSHVKWTNNGNRSLSGQFKVKTVVFSVAVSPNKIVVNIKSPYVSIQGLVVLEDDAAKPVTSRLWEEYLEAQADTVLSELGDVSNYGQR